MRFVFYGPPNMFDFPESLQFHPGDYVEKLVDWITANFQFILDAISAIVLHILIYIQDALLWLPWWFIILAIFLLGWWLRTFWVGVGFSILLFITGVFQLWDLMLVTLALVLTAVFISLVAGIPIGILMAYSKRIEAIMKPTLDFMQTMPAFVYLIPVMIFFGIGLVPAIFSTLVYCAPPIIRLTNLAIRNVSDEMVEAAESFGSSRWQLLIKVQFPQAMPTIMTGANQTTMLALSMVVIASMVGAQGLGMDVLESINSLDIAKGFEAGISIVFLAIIIDRLTMGVAERFNVKK